MRGLRPEIVIAIKTDKINGMSNADLATKYGLTAKTISPIVTGRTYKSIAPSLTVKARRKSKSGSGAIIRCRRKYKAHYANRYIGMYSSKSMAQKAVEIYRTTGATIKDK